MKDIFSTVISYEDLLEACDDMFGFGKATLLRDFGPLKSGQEVAAIWFKLDSAMVEVYSESGAQEQRFPFRLEA